MVAKEYSDLACWRLSDELKRRVYEILKRPKVAKDFDYCDQIRDSARSAPRNIAEGFGKFHPREFARFLQIAKGSLTESHNHLRDGFSQGYLSEEELQDLSSLANRARGATIALIRYLEKCPKKWRPDPINPDDQL